MLGRDRAGENENSRADGGTETDCSECHRTEHSLQPIPATWRVAADRLNGE